MYDEEMESKTLDLSERRRHKRPSSGVRHTRRSASAEMIDRDDDDMRGFENTSPTRRRQRRRKAHSRFLLSIIYNVYFIQTLVRH